MLLGVVLLCISIISCSDSPDCIEERITAFQQENEGRPFTYIYRSNQEGRTLYIFDNGVAFDSIAEIVDEDCNSLCNYGGLRPQDDTDCEAYQSIIDDAEQIWP